LYESTLELFKNRLIFERLVLFFCYLFILITTTRILINHIGV